mgnify:CR=1 FL=1|jgi:hypothetical protein
MKTPEKAPIPKQDDIKNWQEDFPHENGEYVCSCCICDKMFLGHKRRVVCWLCAYPNIVEILTEEYAIENSGKDAWYRDFYTDHFVQFLIKKLLTNLDKTILYSLIPDWAKKTEMKLDPTMYGTGTYEGDMKVIKMVNRLLEPEEKVFDQEFDENTAADIIKDDTPSSNPGKNE